MVDSQDRDVMNDDCVKISAANGSNVEDAPLPRKRAAKVDFERQAHHFTAATRKRAAIAIDDKDDHNKKQKLSDSVVTTTTDDGSCADHSCSDEVSILSTEEEVMMKQIRRIARGGYFEGLEALKFRRSIPTAQPQRIRSVTPPPLTTHITTMTTTTTPTRQSHSPKRAVEITPDAFDQSTLAMLKNDMSDLNFMYSKKKPKEGRWALATAAENIDSWVKDTSGGIVLSVHQLMIFLQAHSCVQFDLHKSFLQKCNLNQFFEDIAPEKIQSDLNTIKKCLKLIQVAASDTTKIAKQIAILKDVSIVQSMIKVKKEKAKSQWEVDSILATAAAPIQELMKKPPVVAARKFVEEECLMTFAIGDTGSKSLEDIKSLCAASYPVPGNNHKHAYHNLGWMKMEGNKTMWILLYAALCAERLTSALRKGSTKDYLGCTLFVEMLPMVLDSHIAKTDKKKGGYPFIFQALCKAFDMNVGEGYWKVINESLPNLKRNCIQLWGKHFLSNPFFPYQAGDIVLWNKHPETSFYTVKEDDCNIEMIHRQCLHVAHTLDLPYHRPTDIELLAIAQVVGMVPAADNSFKFQTTSKAGRTAAAMKVGIHDPNLKWKGSRAHQQWNDDQIKELLDYVITNCESGKRGEIDWSNWDTDGVEDCNRKAGISKLQTLIKQYKRMNEGDDRKTNNDAKTKQFYQIVLAEQLSKQLDNN